MSTIEEVGLPQHVVKDLTQLFKLLADETRLRILHHLFQHRELNVRSLCSLLNQSQPAVSHHLALLRVDGLIECRRDGKHNYYRLLPERLGQLLAMIFVSTPGDSDQIRLDDYILTLRRP
jgi:ArsR family transcriptional regulator